MTLSGVTSGRREFIDGNPNSACRRYHDIVVGLVSDAGGRNQLSEAAFALCQRAAGLTCECELMESGLSRGEPDDLDRYGRVASHARRIWEALGLERKAKLVGQIDHDAELRTMRRPRRARSDVFLAQPLRGDQEIEPAR